jgi:hypothetical protein
MVFWLIIELVLLVASTVLTALLAKSPAGKASALGDFQAPTAEEGRVIPVVFGTVECKGPNVTWYGNLKSTGVRVGFLFKKTVGYKYFMGIHMVLCHGPIDALVAVGYVQNQSGVHVGDGQIVGVYVPPAAHPQTWTLTCLSPGVFGVVGSVSGTQSHANVGIQFSHSEVVFTIVAGPTTPFQVGDQFIFDTVFPSGIFASSKAVTYTTSVSMNGAHENFIDIEMNSPKLFGGDLSGGGIQGGGAFYRGLQTSLPNAYLSAHLPGVNGIAPAYLGICHFVMRQVYIGTQTTLNDMSFVVQVCPDPLSQGNGNINGDANPAWMIWMWMTNQVYGLGEPALRFNQASFIAAAATLFTEKMGMSTITDSETSAEQTISEILRHIDAVLYTDPATGLWTLNLVRNDYVVADLPELTQDDILEPVEFSRVSWEETLNEVKVKYVDRSQFFTERVVQAHESANHAVRGMIGSATFEFHGFSNSTNGQFAATRELKTHSYPLAQLKVIANRVAWRFRMGGVFKLTWPALGISQMVVRISAINYGALENARIEINCVEDIFQITSTGYQPPGFPGWQNPVGPPSPPFDQELMEFPYALTAPTSDRIVMAMAARGDFLSAIFSILSSGQDVADEQPFTPYGVLQNAYPAKTPMDDATGFVCAATPSIDLDTLGDIDPAFRLQGLNIFKIDYEIMAFATITFNLDGTVAFAGVLRGLYDTVPQDHSAGAKVWFFSEGAGQVNTVGFPADLTLSVQCLPSNNYGDVPSGSVSPVGLTTASRAQQPYPPGNALINGISYPSTILGDATFTWADRNRIAQGQAGVKQSDSSIAGGIEGNYTIQVLINGGVVHTHTGLTGNTFTYTLADRVADDSNGAHITAIRIIPVNGSISGTVRTMPFNFTGLGVALGMFLGGIQQ